MKQIRLFLFLSLWFCCVTPLFSETENAKYYLDRGVSLYLGENYFEAIDSFRNALRINPYYGDAYKYLASVYFSLGEYNPSLENAQLALKYANNDPEILLLIANNYRELHSFKQSEEYYRKIVDRFPAFVEVYRNLGELYLRMNKLSLALSMLNKADRVNKSSWRNAISFGNYFMKSGNYEKAESYYQKAFNLNPTERLVYTSLGEFYLATGRYAEAINLLENGEKIFDNFYSGIVILAECYLKTARTPQDFKKAVDKLLYIDQAGIKTDAASKSMNYYKLGLAYETLDPAKSVESYEESLRVDPANEMVRYALESFLLKKFPVDDPVRKDHADAHYAAARKAYSNGERKLYFLHLKRAITLYPFQIDARTRLVEFYESQQDYYNAYVELQSLEKVSPSVRVRDKIEKYEWDLKHNRLRLDRPGVYPYRGLFLVDSDWYTFPSVFSETVLYNSLYYGKFKFSSMEYRKKQGINYILEGLRKNNQSFYVVARQVESKNILVFGLYDRTGRLIDELSLNWNPSSVNQLSIRCLEWMDRTLPTLWMIGKETSPNLYEIPFGRSAGAKEGDSMTAVELDYTGLSVLSYLRLEKVSPYASTVSVVSNAQRGERPRLAEQIAVKSEYLSAGLLTKLKRVLGY